MMSLLVFLFTVSALTNSALAESRHANKRANEENSEGLEAVVMALSAALSQLKAQYSADVNRLETRITSLEEDLDSARRHAAFLAQFSAQRVGGPDSTALKFDHVIFNDGDRYDPAQGVFTAPFSGVYVFCVKTFTAEHETQRPAVDLVRNGQTVDRMAYDYLSSQSGHGGDSHSMSLVLRLAEGDRVWVQMVTGYSADEFYGQFHTSFSGVLIQSD